LTLDSKKIALSRTQSANGVGDIFFIPAAVSWSKGDCKWDLRCGVYTPTGEYDKTNLANVGLNCWTFEPEATFSYLGSKNGFEFDLFAGFDFNTENQATNYTSGDIFHIDVTVAQHLPLFGGFIGVGADGFYLKQFTGDRGSGPLLGNFEASQIGIGPVLTYVHNIGKSELIFDVKWLPQIEVQNTMKGNYVWAKVTFLF
jgi:hypothetical protein